jgi:hypothetical protein
MRLKSPMRRMHPLSGSNQVAGKVQNVGAVRPVISTTDLGYRAAEKAR